jgi:hypothetical protein
VWKPELHQVVLVDSSGEVLATRLDVVDGEVLDGSSEFQVVDVVTLEAANINHCYPAGEKGILTEDFLNAAPAWLATNVNHRGAIDQAVL